MPFRHAFWVFCQWFWGLLILYPLGLGFLGNYFGKKYVQGNYYFLEIMWIWFLFHLILFPFMPFIVGFHYGKAKERKESGYSLRELGLESDSNDDIGIGYL